MDDPQNDGEFANDYYLRKPRNLPANVTGGWNGFNVLYASVTPPPDTLLTVSLADTLYAKVGANGTIGVNTLNGRAGAVTILPTDLPQATQTTLGAVKIGAGLQISNDGVLTTDGSGSGAAGGLAVADIPTATSTVAGLVKVGANLTITNGVLSASSAAYTLPPATGLTLGGVKVGQNLSVSPDGRLSATGYTLPIATDTVLGGVRAGTTLQISNTGLLDVNAAKFVPSNDKGVALGVATLDENGHVYSSQLPVVAISNTYVVPTQLMRLATGAHIGDICVQTNINKTYILRSEPATVDGNWVELLFSYVSVTSINGKVGNVQITGDDIPNIVTRVNNQSGNITLTGPTLANNVYSYNGREGAITYVEGDVPIAKPDKAGLVRPDNTSLTFSNLTTGEISVIEKIATKTDLGMVKVGANLSITADGIIDTTGGGYVLPTANTTTLGGVKVDEVSLTMNTEKVLSVKNPSMMKYAKSSRSYISNLNYCVLETIGEYFEMSGFLQCGVQYCVQPYVRFSDGLEINFAQLTNLGHVFHEVTYESGGIRDTGATFISNHACRWTFKNQSSYAVKANHPFFFKFSGYLVDAEWWQLCWTGEYFSHNDTPLSFFGGCQYQKASHIDRVGTRTYQYNSDNSTNSVMRFSLQGY